MVHAPYVTSRPQVTPEPYLALAFADAMHEFLDVPVGSAKGDEDMEGSFISTTTEDSFSSTSSRSVHSGDDLDLPPLDHPFVHALYQAGDDAQEDTLRINSLVSWAWSQ